MSRRFSYLDALLSPEGRPTPRPAAQSRPPVSERKRAANHANAQKFARPRTPQGKAASSLNALKSGIHASALAVASSATADERQLFESVLPRLYQELQPVGVQEQMLVDRIALVYLRQLRAHRAEADVMSDRLDGERGP